MVRTKTEARREALLLAAMEVFQEKNFEQASMDDIAARAGSSKATLYRYFDSKESLFIELVRHTAVGQGSQMMSLLYRSGGMTDNSRRSNELVDPYALLDPGKDVATTLSSFGQHVLKAFHTPQALGVNRMVIAASVNPEIGRIFYEQGPARALSYLEQYFSRVIADGHLRSADPHVVACHFFGLLESEVHQAGLFNVVTQLSDKEVKGTVARAMDVFLRAYGRVPGA